jgi:hypothetical protein
MSASGDIGYIAAAFLTGVLGPLAVTYTKNYLAKKKDKNPHDMLMDSIEVGNVVSTAIDDIKDEMKCDRVWIAQFHNGGHFYPTGKSIAKFSILYEVVNAEVVSIQTMFQNIPVNLFGKAINQLLKNNTIEITDFKDETIATYGLKYVAEESGCKSGYLYSIKTIDGKFIGIMGIDYVGKKTTLTNKQQLSMAGHSASIGGVLMAHLRS